jgi:hypothetical protein
MMKTAPERPFADKGLAGVAYAICEVVNSTWAKEATSQARRSAERIWGDSFEKAYEGQDWSTSHFIVTLHNSTCEFTNDDFVLTVHNKPFTDVLGRISQRLMEW